MADNGSRARSMVQYYVAVPGLPGAELVMLAARGALLARRRFAGRPGYVRWAAEGEAKIVLSAGAEDLASLARAHDGLLVPAPPDRSLLAVFRPRSRAKAQFVSQLRLYSGSLAALPDVEPPRPGSIRLPLWLNTELGLSAGRAAAAAAGAILALAENGDRTSAWARWSEAGAPLAVLAAPGGILEHLVATGVARGVREGSAEGGATTPLAAAAGPVANCSDWPPVDARLLATGDARSVPQPRPRP